MTPRRRYLFLPVLALAGVAVALWTGAIALAEVAAAGAVLAAGAYTVFALSDRVRVQVPQPPRFEGDPLVLLGRSFREGEFGRRSILARLAGIDPAPLVDPAARAREEAEALAGSEKQFLDYLEGRIAEVERRT